VFNSIQLTIPAASNDDEKIDDLN